MQWTDFRSPGSWSEINSGIRLGSFVDRPSSNYRFYRLLQSTDNPVKLRIAATPARFRTNYSLSFPPLRGWSHNLEIRNSDSFTNWIGQSIAPTGSVDLPSGIDPVNARVTATPPISRENYQTILIGGQSNAEFSDDLAFPDRESHVLYLDRTLGFHQPSKFHERLSQAPFSYSFSTAAAAQLAATVNAPFLLIPIAVGGTAMSQWMPASNRFDRSTLYGKGNFRRVAGSPQPLRAIWYYGHESSTSPNDIPRCAEDWRCLMAEFRTDAGDIPILFAQLATSTDPRMNANNFAGADLQRLSEEGQAAGVPGTHMVVTFDLPLGDAIHLSGAAQRELGRRFALATREHVYGENINGTGPRLESISFLEDGRQVIQVQFSRRINPPVNAYDQQFVITSNGVPVAVADITRARGETAVLIHLEHPHPGAISITYGSRHASQTGQYLTNVIRDLSGLPAPRFGPVHL